VSEEPVDELHGSIVPAPRASIVHLFANHALTRVATHCRRFAPLFFAGSEGVGALRGSVRCPRRRRGPTLRSRRRRSRRFAPLFFAGSEGVGARRRRAHCTDERGSMTRAMSAPSARTHAAVAEKTDPALRASVPDLSGRSSRNANDLQTSLEEAEVRRPGREAGKLTLKEPSAEGAAQEPWKRA